jgi:hypothetical protein
MIDAFAELTLETRDPRRLERFYREAFGFEVLSRDADRVWLGVGTPAGIARFTSRIPRETWLRCGISSAAVTGPRTG